MTSTGNISPDQLIPNDKLYCYKKSHVFHTHRARDVYFYVKDAAWVDCKNLYCVNRYTDQYPQADITHFNIQDTYQETHPFQKQIIIKEHPQSAIAKAQKAFQESLSGEEDSDHWVSVCAQ